MDRRREVQLPMSFWRNKALGKRQTRLLEAHDIAVEIDRAKQEPALPCLYTWPEVLALQVQARIYWLVYRDLRLSRRAFMTLAEFRHLVDLNRARVMARWNGPTGVRHAQVS